MLFFIELIMKRHANEGDEREREKKRSSFPFYNNYYNTIESVYFLFTVIQYFITENKNNTFDVKNIFSL